MKKVPLSGKNGNGKYILVDDCDFDLVAQHKWNIDPQGYAMTHIRVYGTDVRVRIQRYILNPPDRYEIDHKNHDKLDNRRENIRLVTPSQNGANKKPTSASGYKGVHMDNRAAALNKRWVAAIKVNGKKYHLGRFYTKEEAAQAYNDAAIKHFGEYAYLNPV